MDNKLNFKVSVKSLSKASDSTNLKDLSLKTTEETLQLNENQVLIKTHACPINPLDILKLNNIFHISKFPLTLGSECSGEILESYNKDLIGKKVSALITGGSYKSHHVVDIENIIIHNDDADLNSLACMSVNPLTCLGLVSLVDSKANQGVVNLASNSALGKMVYRLCREKNIEVINVVRTEKKKLELEKEVTGIKNILVMEDNDFYEKLSKLSLELNAVICLDPIGSITSGKILKALPFGSRLIVYGSLSEKPIEGVDGSDLRNNDKGILGFALLIWMTKKLSKDERKATFDFLINNRKLFESNIKNIYNVENYSEAFEEYVKDMSAGKILLKFN